MSTETPNALPVAERVAAANAAKTTTAANPAAAAEAAKSNPAPAASERKEIAKQTTAATPPQSVERKTASAPKTALPPNADPTSRAAKREAREQQDSGVMDKALKTTGDAAGAVMSAKNASGGGASAAKGLPDAGGAAGAAKGLPDAGGAAKGLPDAGAAGATKGLPDANAVGDLPDAGAVAKKLPDVSGKANPAAAKGQEVAGQAIDKAKEKVEDSKAAQQLGDKLGEGYKRSLEKEGVNLGKSDEAAEEDNKARAEGAASDLMDDAKSHKEETEEAVGDVAVETGKGAAEGGLAGAAVGAGRGVLKSKKGRQLVTVLIVMALMPFLIGMGAILFLMLGAASFMAAQESNSQESAQGQSITGDGVVAAPSESETPTPSPSPSDLPEPTSTADDAEPTEQPEAAGAGDVPLAVTAETETPAASGDEPASTSGSADGTITESDVLDAAGVRGESLPWTLRLWVATNKPELDTSAVNVAVANSFTETPTLLMGTEFSNPAGSWVLGTSDYDVNLQQCNERMVVEALLSLKKDENEPDLTTRMSGEDCLDESHGEVSTILVPAGEPQQEYTAETPLVTPDEDDKERPGYWFTEAEAKQAFESARTWAMGQGFGCGATAPLNNTADGADAEGGVGNWDAEQIENARQVIAAAKGYFADQPESVQEKAGVLGLATAIQESRLVSLGHGDDVGPDSRGLFQQRDTWGTEEQRLTPVWAAARFYHKLATIDGWEAMSIGDASYAVQIYQDGLQSKYEDAADDAQQLWDRYAPATQGVGEAGNMDSFDQYVNGAVPMGGMQSCNNAGGFLVGSMGYPIDPADGPGITSYFGPRGFVTDGASSWHRGIDLSGGMGVSLYAIFSGTVTYNDWLGSGGNTIIVQNESGISFTYMHLESPSPLPVGTKVEMGQEVGLMGSTGASTGAHLHMEINVSEAEDFTVSDAVPYAEMDGRVEPVITMRGWGVDLCPPNYAAFSSPEESTDVCALLPPFQMTPDSTTKRP